MLIVLCVCVVGRTAFSSREMLRSDELGISKKIAGRSDVVIFMLWCYT